ncbi:dihydrofolate reductase family protein [Nostoc sp. 106C]|uniref:dihydrofolate reductase family protein n=1 Tax=Nostoc sp. 106C TaxID=1932667 RepID=UPI000A389BBB|nr:dihydrofolate reductase family protein [Nostoc sp. 106C]OUL32162.1 deaminase [Nostoc sp. 106C]
MRKLKYHVACTVDGFIAHKDHTIEGFIPEGDHVTDYLESLQNDYDIVLMGRKTYEFGFQFGVTNPYPLMKQYVLSRTMETSPDPNVELVSENIIDFVRELKTGTGKDIYLCGGAYLATTLLTENLINEIILKVNPVVFGSGIPLFSEAIKQTDLELIDSKIYKTGVILLTYRVKH